MHYWGYTLLEVKGQWGYLLPPCLLIAPVQQLRTSSPPSQLKHSSENVIWMCKPPSPTAPVFSHGLALWSPPSGSVGGSPMHAPLQPTSPSFPSLAGILVFLQSRFQSLLDVDLAAPAAAGVQHTIFNCLLTGNVSLTLVNIEQRVCLDLRLLWYWTFYKHGWCLHSSQPHRVSPLVVPSPPSGPCPGCSCLLFPVWVEQKCCQ